MGPDNVLFNYSIPSLLLAEHQRKISRCHSVLQLPRCISSLIASESRISIVVARCYYVSIEWLVSFGLQSVYQWMIKPQTVIKTNEMFLPGRMSFIFNMVCFSFLLPLLLFVWFQDSICPRRDHFRRPLIEFSYSALCPKIFFIWRLDTIIVKEQLLSYPTLLSQVKEGKML